MKNKYSILLLVVILIAVGGFAILSSGTKIPYLENYGTNFRRNVKSIANTFNWDLPQPVDRFLSKTPEPLTTEEKLAIIEKMETEQNEVSPTAALEIENDSLLSATSKIIAVKNAHAAAYSVYKSKLLCATDTQLTCYNSDGSTAWGAEIQISNPILKTAGNYILVAEKNAAKSYLFNGEKRLWENVSENTIISADVSNNGDVVFISDKPQYKGAVTVVNRKGDTIYRWNSGKFDIIDADIAPSSRKLVVSLLDTGTGADTKLSFFDLNKSESYQTIELSDCIAFDVEFCGETLNVITDNKIMGANTAGTIIWTKDFEGKNLHRYQVEDSGYKLCVFDHNNVSQINVITNRGSDKTRFESEAFPEHLFLSGGYLLYDNGRELWFSTLSGKNPKKYNCTRDICDLFILDAHNLAVIYNSSIEFIKI